MPCKLVFIGRTYHAKTKSDELILELLRKSFDVVVIRREEFTDKEIVKKINELAPFAVLFWCLPPSFTYHLLHLKCKNIFWAPMWDGFKPLSLKRRWLFSFYDVKILCFSKVLYDYFKKIKLKCAYWQCFLKPMQNGTYKTKGPYTFFFWQRDHEIHLDRIVEMVGEENISRVIYKTEIKAKPHKKYSFEIEKLPDWIEKDKYVEKMHESDFFIAPRKAEGIGFSFLEPMSYGKPIIGYDNATMNEYIQDGVNGYLFKKEFKLKSPLSAPHNLAKSIEKISSNLYRTWDLEKEKVSTFILQKGVLND